MNRLALLFIFLSVAGCGDAAPPPPVATTQAVDPQAIADLREQTVELLHRRALTIESESAQSRTMVLSIAGSDPSWSGTALVTRDDSIVERKLQLQLSPASDVDPPTLRCTLGPLTDPAILPPASGETLVFTPWINARGQLVLSTSDRFVLGTDPAGSEGFTRYYADVVNLHRRMIAALHADLGAVAFLNADAKRAALIRVPDKDAYDFVRFDGPDAALLPTAARTRYTVAIRDADALLINAAANATLVRAGDGQTLVSTIAGIEHRLTITTTYDAASVAMAQDAAKATLAQLRVAPAHFAATQPADGPAMLTLGCDDGTRVIGTQTNAVGHAEPIVGTFTPSLVGLVVQFGVASNPAGTTRAALDVVDGQLTLTGINHPLRMTAAR